MTNLAPKPEPPPPTTTSPPRSKTTTARAAAAKTTTTTTARPKLTGPRPEEIRSKMEIKMTKIRIKFPIERGNNLNLPLRSTTQNGS